MARRSVDRRLGTWCAFIRRRSGRSGTLPHTHAFPGFVRERGARTVVLPEWLYRLRFREAFR